MCAHFFLFKIENRIETIPLSLSLSLEEVFVVYRPPSSQGKSRHFLTGERGAERLDSICIAIPRLVGLLLGSPNDDLDGALTILSFLCK